MVANPITIKRGSNGFGIIFKAVRVYIGESNDYRMHHIVEVSQCCVEFWGVVCTCTPGVVKHNLYDLHVAVTMCLRCACAARYTVVFYASCAARYTVVLLCVCVCRLLPLLNDR